MKSSESKKHAAGSEQHATARAACKQWELHVHAYACSSVGESILCIPVVPACLHHPGSVLTWGLTPSRFLDQILVQDAHVNVQITITWLLLCCWSTCSTKHMCVAVTDMINHNCNCKLNVARIVRTTVMCSIANYLLSWWSWSWSQDNNVQIHIYIVYQ